MKFRSYLAAGFAFVAALAMADGATAELKVGAASPNFKLPGSDGQSYKLSDYEGKQMVVLAWFPKAFTGG